MAVRQKSLIELINGSISQDVHKLLESKEFQRFFFWLLGEAQVFARPNWQGGQEALLMAEGKRDLGLALIALAPDYTVLDTCQQAYLQKISYLKKNRKEEQDV